MKDFRCDFAKIRDAIANSGLYSYVICQIFEFARTTLKEGSSVTFYEDYGENIIDPNEIIFNNLDDFNNWVELHFSFLNC